MKYLFVIATFLTGCATAKSYDCEGWSFLVHSHIQKEIKATSIDEANRQLFRSLRESVGTSICQEITPVISKEKIVHFGP